MTTAQKKKMRSDFFCSLFFFFFFCFVFLFCFFFVFVFFFSTLIPTFFSFSYLFSPLSLVGLSPLYHTSFVPSHLGYAPYAPNFEDVDRAYWVRVVRAFVFLLLFSSCPSYLPFWSYAPLKKSEWYLMHAISYEPCMLGFWNFINEILMEK